MKSKNVSMFVLDDCNPDVRVLKLANTLVKNNFKVQIHATRMNKKAPRSETLDNGVTIKRINVMRIPFLFYLEYWIKMILYYGNQKTDIIVCHDLNALPLGVLLKKKHKNAKLIYDTHEFFPLMVQETKGRFFFWIFTTLEKFLISKPDHVTTISDLMSYYIKTYYNLNKELISILNVPNESILDYPTLKFKKEPNEVLFAFVGNIIPLTRGFELLTDWAKHIKSIRKENDPKIKIIVIGDGPYRKTIQQIVKNEGHDDLIKFVGVFPYTKAMSLTKGCDVGLILIHPASLNTLYVSPNRLFEYLGNELPILATDLYEFRNIVVKENCGWIAPLNDPEQLAETMMEIARHKDEILLKKKNVKPIFLKKYSWERMEKKLLDLYENL